MRALDCDWYHGKTVTLLTAAGKQRVDVYFICRTPDGVPIYLCDTDGGVWPWVSIIRLSRPDEAA